MITQKFNIYLHAGIAFAPVVHCSQYSQGETWTFTILDNDGSVYRPSSGALIGVKSDGNVIAGITGTVNSDGSVSIVTTQQLTAAAGRGIFELTIDGGTNGTANFIVEVEPKPTDGGVLSESDLSIIQQGINSVTPAVITETVSDYLSEHMTNPPIDPTLTVSNAAADAKVTGDEITDLKTDLSDFVRTPTIRNGSRGNPANANAISFKEIVPVWESRTLMISTDVPLESGYHYSWWVAEYSVESGDPASPSTNPYLIRDRNVFASTDSAEIEVTLATNTKGVAVYLFEKDDDANSYPLRIANTGTKCISIYNEPLYFRNLKDKLYTQLTRETFAYIGGGGKLEFYTSDIFNASGRCAWKLNNKLCVKCPTSNLVTFSMSQIIASLTSDDLYVDSNSETWIYMRAGYALAYNDETQSIESVQVNGITPLADKTYPLLMFWTYQAVGGLLYWKFLYDAQQVGIDAKADADALKKYDTAMKDNIVVPVLRNGSVGNSGNANAVCTRYVIPINKNYNELVFEYFGDESTADSYAMNYCLFSGATDGMTTDTAFVDPSISKYNYESGVRGDLTEKAKRVLDLTTLGNYDHISVAVFRYLNGVAVPIRIADEQYSIKISYRNTERDLQNDEILHLTNNARHVKRDGTPNYLTLLHFSDLHADTGALNRIYADGISFGAKIDDMICTGDIVANSYEQITSWWKPEVMTCIGNHDSASYNTIDGYNWTALSMAERDAYYIAPFESNWGITHVSGTSYYYKDYTTQKIRLIVMDGMLYSSYESVASLATAQTAWLENLLADAITNSLHVLIAIHAPHGGATAVECSFTKYNQGIRPIYTDCDTPQVVIDAVSNAITNGLKFVGYIVGHSHQDAVWDAENDRKQLMYCVTCAAVSQTAQWANSDQHRSTSEDAYNIVTIDTTNTLVKIIRGGGADIDDHMRTRKAICFNYSTGQKVGEVM